MPEGPVEKAFEKERGEHELLIYKVCSIYAYAQRDREDLCQEIVLQLWKSYHRFRGESKFSTWLYRIAINTALSGLRKQNPLISSDEPARLPVQTAEIKDNKDERTEELYAAINQLNDIEKAIVVLYLEEHSYEEMEEVLGIPNGALRVKMTRIKEKLRQLTKKWGHGI